MTNEDENRITVISPEDPNLPNFVDFKALRKEGLKHIGNLSGKIWTDHNVHDPGITILEVLVYALMDLGYKTNLPFEELIALPNAEEKDDNFLTPLEILTINPVTITDYRKLLLEIEGVRNAWLEPVAQKTKLYIDEDTNRLNCGDITSSDNSNYDSNDTTKNEGCPIPSPKYAELNLNGLYKVYIEKDADIIQNEDQEKELVQEVRELLVQYRNLCEDFEDICVLEPIDIGICLEAEIIEGFEAERVYVEIIKRVKDFIQPEIKYYTLNELLDKGRSIDTIFAGRPYRQESFGFVDTEELESRKRRTEIYLSDLYNVVLTIEGVRKIKKATVSGGIVINAPSETWVEGNQIPDDQVPVFSLDKTCVELFSTEGGIQLDKPKTHKTFSFIKKFDLQLKNLDSSVPGGQYREDLDEYYSIQNDFPVVYGIGEDGLSESATLERKTEALQLKGYLIFYDQILANYTSQLSNIRSLFSLKPETERGVDEKHTYFTQIPETIPGLEKLLRFHAVNKTIPEGTLLALPVANTQEVWTALNDLQNNPRTEFTIENYCKDNDALVSLFSFSSAAVRSIYINQLIDTFFNENYTIGIFMDKFGFFFVLYPTLPNDILLVGTKRYAAERKAKNEAKNLAFISSTPESYNLVSEVSDSSSPDNHYFDVSYRPISYAKLIPKLTEDNDEYITRRKQFLDHLLARFGEEFTNYSILLYQSKMNTADQDQQTINDQSAYLNQFAEISRNRGRAYNYLEPSWNTANVSGYEKRVSLLSGINNYERRNLCNFEVTQCYRLLLKDVQGATLFRSNRSYQSKAELREAAKKVLSQLRKTESYKRLEKSLNGFDACAVQRIFSEKPSEENIVVTKYHYHQKLVNFAAEKVVESKNKKMASAETAIDRKADFISTINEQTSTGQPKIEAYRLLALDDENRYLDTNALETDIKTLKSWKWHLKDPVASEKKSCELVFTQPTDAWDHLVEEAALDNYLTKHDVGLSWNLPINKTTSFHGLSSYPNAQKAVASWRQAKTLANSTKNFGYKLEDEGTVILELKNEKGSTIAVTNGLVMDPLEVPELIENCIKKFSSRKAKPNYKQEAGKFGFRIPKKDNTPLLESYCVYETEKVAMQEMSKVYTLGKDKKNYLQSGDEGNPEYNFILKDRNATFLALPPEHFETSSDRNKALGTMTRFVKANTLPVQVKEEPRRYVWSLNDKDKVLLTSETEFTSEKRARKNLDTVLVKEAVKGNLELFKSHCFEFEHEATPALFNFVYGGSSAQNELDPVFMGPNSLKSKEEATKAYANFAEKLPGLSLQSSPREGSTYNFALYGSDKTRPVAIQYKKGAIKASFEKAKALTTYITNIYNTKGVPKEQFVNTEMSERQDGLYEWRFYKKNAPVARSPYLCVEESDADRIKAIICDIIPPINLYQCPPREVVICPEKDPKKYHFQVSFSDDRGDEFVLNSFVGFDSHKEASDAGKEQWLEIIEIAKDREQYKKDGKISVTEIYKDPESKDCDDATFIAVIPKEIKDSLGLELISHYTRLANLFPIYKLDDEDDEKCDTKYQYRVTISKEFSLKLGCTLAHPTPFEGSLLWESTQCYDTTEDAISAYLHFYTLAGTSNNCRLLCENNKFFVGLVEVLAESACEFDSEAQAWDDAYPKLRDECNNCIPGGVREFIYAAEDDKNYVPICDQNYWKFKVVSPDYFVADHSCFYNSKIERDEQLQVWLCELTELDWTQYITTQNSNSTTLRQMMSHLVEVTENNSNFDNFVKFCDLIITIRDCLKVCSHTENDTTLNAENDGKAQFTKAFEACLNEKLKGKGSYSELLNNSDLTIDDLDHMTKFFPVYKTEDGYCYRLYKPLVEEMTTPNGLQPCGCEDDEQTKTETSCNETNVICNEPYPFISSRCFDCCEEALNAFIEFCQLITSGTYGIECTSKTAYGPYSFQIIDKSKESAYHPQQYDSLQEVKDAIAMTKACVDDAGMHLLEHILLRPNNIEECGNIELPASTGFNKIISNCLLPICPDYCCPIEWQPDIERDDPCADTHPDNIYYIPGGDPYSFWATLVLPAWSKRFRSDEARQAFEKLLYREAPALVGLNILWLSPRDLCKFEDEYRKWLEWKQDPTAVQCDQDISPICALSNCIATLCSEMVCPTIPGAQGDCKCESSEPDTDSDISYDDINTRVRRPCIEENRGDANFETQFNCSAASHLRTANDLTVASNEDFELNQISAHILANVGIASVDVIYLDDNNGLPGQTIGSEAGIVPTSQTIIGANTELDVYEIVLDVTPFVFACQPGAITTYWIELSVTDIESTEFVYWLATSASRIGQATAHLIEGWTIRDPSLDGVYSWSGNCISKGGGGNDRPDCSEDSLRNAFKNGFFNQSGSKRIENDVPVFEASIDTVVTTKPVRKTSVSKKVDTKRKGSSVAIQKQFHEKQSTKELVSVVRKRSPQYLTNIKTDVAENIRSTKSGERVEFFLLNPPTIKGYVELVNFFDRYSLKNKSTADSYLTLLKNATWHLFDKLALEEKEGLKKEEIDALNTSLQLLKKKGLSLPEINKDWKSAHLKTLAHRKPVNQIKKLLKP